MNNSLKVKSKRTLSSRVSHKLLKHRKETNVVHQIPEHVVETKPNYKKVISFDCNDSANTLRKTPLKLDQYFFNRRCITLAKDLLGKTLVRKLDSGEILKGRIVEAECYLGTEDKASHSYQGKKTERNEAMFLKPGTAYVYTIYGMYYCLNISSLEEGSAVLIRALEPLQNAQTMLSLRLTRRKGSKVIKEKDICNGPSKLCQAFKIDKHSLNKIDLCTSEDLWLEEGTDISDCDIIACKRIGIDSAGEEWANKPLRFYIKNCTWVSVRNKMAEKTEMYDV